MKKKFLIIFLFSFLFINDKILAKENYVINKSIGYSINLAKAGAISEEYIETGSPILRDGFIEELFDSGRIIYTNLAMRTTNETYGTNSFKSLAEDLSNQYEKDFDLDVEYDIFTEEINSGFSWNAGINFSRNSNSYFYTNSFETKVYKLDLPNYSSNLEEYIENLHPNFLNKLSLLDSGKLSYEDFFDIYGTHFIGSAIFGAKLQMYYGISSSEQLINSSFATSLTKIINKGIVGLGEIDAKIDFKDDINILFLNKKYSDVFYLNSFGGAYPFSSTSYLDFTRNYNNWITSISNDTAGLTNFGRKGLISIENLIPNKYVNVHNNIEQEIKKYFENNTNSIYDYYKYDNQKYSGNYKNSFSIRDDELKITDDGYNGLSQPFDVVNITLNDELNFYEYIALGYNYVKISVKFEAKEIDSGYQQFFIYGDEFNEDLIYMKEFEHGKRGKPNKNYIEYNFNTGLIEIDKFKLKDKFYIRWDAHGDDDDSWVNKNLKVIMEFIR